MLKLKKFKQGEIKKTEVNKEDLFPDLKLMRSFGIREIELAEAPDPKICIIEMINIQLRVIILNISINYG